jgi:hypothetical protein
VLKNLTPHRKALLIVLMALVVPALIAATGETGYVGSLRALSALHAYGWLLIGGAALWFLKWGRRRRRPVLALALLTPLVAVGAALAPVQYTNFTPRCSGTNDTSEFSAISSTMGSDAGSVRLPWIGGSRCAVGTLTLPANVAIDSTNSTGLKVNDGATLTVRGSIVSPVQQVFYNVSAGHGTVRFTGNTSIPVYYAEWFGARAGDGTRSSRPTLTRRTS